MIRFPIATLILSFCLTLLIVSDAGLAEEDNLRKALTFHASFDQGTDAAFALGDRHLYTASSYKNFGDSKPGIGNPDVSVASGEGRFGDALRFKKRNTKAIYYKAEKNVAYQPGD